VIVSHFFLFKLPIKLSYIKGMTSVLALENRNSQTSTNRSNSYSIYDKHETSKNVVNL
jgi:hypothetical protein